MKKRYCPYLKCAIPNDNNKYGWQAVYLIVSFAYLIKDTKEFTVFSLFLFIVPALLDLIYGPLGNKTLNSIRKVLMVVDVAITVCCVLGLFGVIIDAEASFEVTSTALILANLGVSKKTVTWILAVNLVVPVIYFFGSPSKKTITVANAVEKAFDNYAERGGNRVT